MIRLYDYLPSGNGYKVRLLLTQLGVPFELRQVDITRGETRTPEFLAMNPNGKIPLIELGPDQVLAESHAILWYFAEGSEFIPEDPWERAQVLQWMCFEQYSLEPYIAVARFWLHQKTREELGENFQEKVEGGARALEVLAGHLEDRSFMVAERYTLADVALYAYVHVAEEGGFELRRYPPIERWLANVRAQPNHRRISEA